MTAILAYTPMVSAQVRAQTVNGYKYYDLTDDITNFSVTLNTDGCSTFSLTLQNVGGKYDGAFKPMDAIAIYLSKANRYQVLAGYVTKAPYYNLNTDEVEIRGRDVLYRLQKLYWDAGLEESFWLVYRGQDDTEQDGGYWKSGVKVLQAVADWPASKISVGQIPSDVIEWATSMYQAKLSDTQGADMVNQIYKMLQTSGPAIGGASEGSSSGGAADFSGNSNAEVVWNFCMSQGFSKQAAAGVIGNMQQESGVDPAACQGGGGPGRGLLQWEAGSGRFSDLCAFASERGTEWTDIQAQLLFFVSEAAAQFDAFTGNGVYTYPNGAQAWIAEKMTFDQFKAITDLPWATEAFERVYTRGSVPMMEKRIAYARSAYDQFGG